MAQDGKEGLDLSVTLGDSVFTASGPAELVMKAFDEFKSLVGTTGPKRAAPKKEENQKPTGPAATEAAKMPLPRFLARDEVKGKGNPKIATAIVAWAADHDGKATVTVPDIRKFWRKTSVKLPGNLARDVDTAVKRGMLHREGNDISITGYGRSEIGLTESE